MPRHPFEEFNLDPALAEAVAGVEPDFEIEAILRLENAGEIPQDSTSSAASNGSLLAGFERQTRGLSGAIPMLLV